MNKKERTRRALLRQLVDRYPIFSSATPQFLARAAPGSGSGGEPSPAEEFAYWMSLDMDVVQVGHPSFYPVKIMELPEGTRYVDEFTRTHVIARHFDEFCAPYPLRKGDRRMDAREVGAAWDGYEFPDPRDPAWFKGVDAVVDAGKPLDDPPATWGVINGPFEPAWQLVSDGWVELFILARKDPDLATSIMERVTAYCIEAGAGMIEHGVDAIRIGDDYALNEGLMCKPSTWHDFIFPWHRRLVAGLKKAAGDSTFPVILHSDGDISTILDWLAGGGIDAINPIQPGALDFEQVVREHGHHLAMTGAFDLRHFLQPCTGAARQEMERDVERLMGIVDAYNQGPHRTGYCIGSSHQVQPASDPATFAAWVAIVHAANDRRAAHDE